MTNSYKVFGIVLCIIVNGLITNFLVQFVLECNGTTDAPWKWSVISRLRTSLRQPNHAKWQTTTTYYCSGSGTKFWNVSPPMEKFSYCDQLFERHPPKYVLRGAKSWKPKQLLNDTQLLEVSRNCSYFQEMFGFAEYPKSEEEACYPHAYAILIHKDAYRVVQLLQLIYWPQNTYCIHVDSAMQETEFFKIFENISECYKNIFLASKMYRSKWGSPEILLAAVNCLKVLDAEKKPWNYVQIYSGVDVPLKTNAELVEIFKILNGSNLVGGNEKLHVRRFVLNYTGPDGAYAGDVNSGNWTRIPPGGIIPYKGSFQAVMARAFVKFMLENPIAQELLTFTSNTLVADETYWPTLNHNIHLQPPGGFPGICFIYYDYFKKHIDLIPRYQVWDGSKEASSCKSEQWSMGSCVFGVKDLYHLTNRTELAVHKMYQDFQPAAFACLAEWHQNATFDIKTAGSPPRYFDYDYYRNFPPVVYNRLIDKTNWRCV